MIVNIKKRYAYFIMGLLILAIGVFVVNALTPGVAPNPGHTIDTVAPPTECGDGQVLQFIDEASGWGCVGLSVDTDTRCDASGQCSQVCIGSDCQSDWPEETSYSNCYWHTTTVFHAYDGQWDTVTCPANCVMQGIRTGEWGPTNERHQIYCCCN